VFYDVGVRLRTSERGRLNNQRVGFNIGLHPDKKFRGVHETLSIDRSGGIRFGRSFGQDEILVKHIVNHAGRIPGMYDDMIRVIAPRTAHTSTALLLMARFNDVFLESQFENGTDGTLYTYELIYYPTTTEGGRPDGLKLPQPDQVIGVDIQDLGDDKESYRWFFLKENNRARDDYAGLMRFCKRFTAPTAELEEAAEEVMDVDEWLRTFAMYSLCGIGDTYAQGLEHNNMHYVRPRDNRVLVFPWDMDFAFVRDTNAGLWGGSNLARIISRPRNARRFSLHLLDIIDTTYNRTYMAPWVTHYGGLCNQNFSSITAYIHQRANYVLSRLRVDPPLEITTQRGEDFVILAENVEIEGRGAYEIAELRLNGEPLDVQWYATTRWRVVVPLKPGPNELIFEGLDRTGAVVGEDRITVTSTINFNPPSVALVTPTMGPSTGGTEVQLFGENFDPASVVRFGEREALAVTYLSAATLTAVSPPGEGSVQIHVENPDGLTGTAAEPFTYTPVPGSFRRADVNADGTITISDAVTILGHLFLSRAITCRDAADVNDDGLLRLDDPVALLEYLFLSGSSPAAPFPTCGLDPPGDALDCESHAGCR
jgi:hypothetical protein